MIKTNAIKLLLVAMLSSVMLASCGVKGDLSHNDSNKSSYKAKKHNYAKKKNVPAKRGYSKKESKDWVK